MYFFVNTFSLSLREGNINVTFCEENEAQQGAGTKLLESSNADVDVRWDARGSHRAGLGCPMEPHRLAPGVVLRGQDGQGLGAGSCGERGRGRGSVGVQGHPLWSARADGACHLMVAVWDEAGCSVL